MTANEAKELLTPNREKLTGKGVLSIGCSLLNLSCSDSPDYAFIKGGYYFLVGDTSSGKTFLTMTILAEAARNPAFKDYDLIYDDVEGGALMDLEYFFGKELAKRIQPAAVKDGKSVNSLTVEDFYYHLYERIRKRKCVYILDSQDALDSEAAKKKFLEQKKAQDDEKQSKGSYGVAKAKYHSENLRREISRARSNGSIIIVVSQTRDNLGFSFDPRTRSGGRALAFYANLEIWTSVAGKINKTVRGREREVGIKVLAHVKKNRVTGKVGKDRAAVIHMYNSFGIDEVGSCVSYLIEEGHWEWERDEKKRKIFNAEDFNVKGTREEIISHIENEDLEGKLSKTVARVWKEIEDECAVKRKRRYE